MCNKIGHCQYVNFKIIPSTDFYHIQLIFEYVVLSFTKLHFDVIKYFIYLTYMSFNAIKSALFLIKSYSTLIEHSLQTTSLM